MPEEAPLNSRIKERAVKSKENQDAIPREATGQTEPLQAEIPEIPTIAPERDETEEAHARVIRDERIRLQAAEDEASQAAILDELQDMKDSQRERTSETEEQEARLERVFAGEEEKRRQLEWEIAAHAGEYTAMMDKMFAAIRDAENRNDVDRREELTQYLGDTVSVLKTFGVEVKLDKGKYTLDLPDYMKGREQEQIKTEYLQLDKHYSRVSIRTHDVLTTNEWGKKEMTQQRFLVVEGSQRQFRDIVPKDDWTEEDERFAQQCSTLQDLRYEFYTNDTKDENFYVWKQLSDEDIAHMQMGMVDGTLVDQVFSDEGVTAEDFASEDEKTRFDTLLRINDLVSENAVPQAFVHGWMADERVMEHVIRKGLAETQALLPEGKFAVGIGFDTDGIHGNLADKIPGLRLGEQSLTAPQGAAQTEYALNNFFGFVQNEGLTVWGWSRGGARNQELHARLADLGASGVKYGDITPCMEGTAIFKKPQEGQRPLGKLASKMSQATLGSAALLHRFGVTRTAPGRGVFNPVSEFYANTVIQSEDEAAKEAAEIHRQNVANPDEVAVMALQNRAMEEYEGLTEESRRSIRESVDADDSWAMEFVAGKDRLVGETQLEHALMIQNLGLPAFKAPEASHALLLENDFQENFPMGLVNAATPHELHRVQQLWEELAVMNEMQLTSQQREKAREIIWSDGVRFIFDQKQSDLRDVPEDRLKLMDITREALDYMTSHLQYYDERGNKRMEMAKIRLGARLRGEESRKQGYRQRPSESAVA